MTKQNIEKKVYIYFLYLYPSLYIHITQTHIYIKQTNLMEFANSKEKTHSHTHENIIPHSNKMWHIKMYHKCISSEAYFIKCIVYYILSVFYTNVILISYKNTLNKRFMRKVANLFWPINRNSFVSALWTGAKMVMLHVFQ